MGLPFHRNYSSTQSNIHTPYWKEFADAAAREAYTVVADDIAAGKRKLALQLDDFSEWVPIATGAGAAKWQQPSAAAGNVDTDGSLAANSDAFVPSQKAVKTYVDGLLGAMDAFVYKGAIDCSTNPNYPTADAGHTYKVSVAGKIGGASGEDVEVGDVLICLTDATSGGDQATVGAYWDIIQTNVKGPFSTSTKTDVLQAAMIGGADSGSANAYAVAFTPAITALVVGVEYVFKAANANTGASTLNLQSLGAQAIKKLQGGITTALEANDIRANQLVVVRWDGTNFQMMSPLGNVPTPSTTPVLIQVACSDEATALTAGTAKVTFRAPYAFTLTAVRASVTTAPTGGTLLTIDINEAGTTVLSTKLTFDASAKTTVGATTPAVISDAAIADDAEITIDIDAIGSTIAGAGLKVTLIGTKP